MTRTPVKSTQLKSVGHDPATNKLHIEFKSGAVYEYDDVPVEEYAELMNAPSIGQHFSSRVKYGFVYRKLS